MEFDWKWRIDWDEKMERFVLKRHRDVEIFESFEALMEQLQADVKFYRHSKEQDRLEAIARERRYQDLLQACRKLEEE